MVTVTDTAPIAGQNDEREQKSMNRETYETYSVAEPEKIDLIAFLAEYFQAFQKFFFGVLALVILAGGGSFLTAKLRYQPVYEAYTSFVVGSNRAVGYSYYDNVTAEQLGKTFPYLVTSGVLKDVVARDLGIGAVTSEIQASVMENTNLFTIRVRDASPETAYRVMKSVITNYPEVAEYIIGATTLTVVDESGVPAVPVNSQDALRAGTYGAAAGLAAAFLLLFLYVRTRKTIHWADDIKKLTNAAFLGNLPQAKIKKRSSVKEQTITICNPKVPDAFKEAVQLIRTRTEDRIIGKSDCPVLLVTSAVPGEGKTTVAVNLAEAFAKKKYRVVLLDGDLRNPSVMKCMGLIGRKERGIAAVLKGQMDWEEALTDCRDLTLKILPGAGSDAESCRAAALGTDEDHDRKPERRGRSSDHRHAAVRSAFGCGTVRRNCRRSSSRGTSGNNERPGSPARAGIFRGFADSGLRLCAERRAGGHDGLRIQQLWQLRVWKIWLRLRKVRLWERKGTPEQ
mgnify:CR=1 FL=1